MRVKIVHHQHNFLGLRVVFGQQLLEEVSPVFLGASPAHFEVALAC